MSCSCCRDNLLEKKNNGSSEESRTLDEWYGDKTTLAKEITVEPPVPTTSLNRQKFVPSMITH